MNYKELLLKSLDEAIINLEKLEGGPFGAIILCGDKIISQAHNTVLKDHDPTAHAEINAIRQACKKLNKEHLDDCVLITNVEPCPMCLSASYWAHIKEIIYITSHEELALISDFDDNFIYQEIKKDYKNRKIKFIKFDELKEKNEKLFQIWKKLNKHY